MPTFYCWYAVSWTTCLGWPQTVILPISTFHRNQNNRLEPPYLAYFRISNREWLLVFILWVNCFYSYKFSLARRIKSSVVHSIKTINYMWDQKQAFRAGSRSVADVTLSMLSMLEGPRAGELSSVSNILHLQMTQLFRCSQTTGQMYWWENAPCLFGKHEQLLCMCKCYGLTIQRTVIA
jgi:hypothetical protein